MSDDFPRVTIDSVLESRTAGYWGQAEKTEQASEHVNIVRAGDISPDGHLLGWAERWVKPREASRASCVAGDVLITASGNGLGKCYLVRDGDALVSSNFTRRLSPRSENILGHFLYLALQSSMGASKLAEHTATSAFPNLKPTFFEDPWLPLPPIPVQRRIVDLMAHLDNHLASMRAERDAVSSLLAQQRARAMAIGEPRRAGDVFEILMGRQRSPQRAEGPSMTPYLRAANIKDGRLDLTDVKEMDFDETERSRFGLMSEDVLVSEGSGSADAVGAAAKWSGEIEGPVCFQNTLLRYRALEDATLPSFVYHWCRWAYESGAFKNSATGTNILHIGSTRAVGMAVRVPGLPEQQVLCDLLDDVENAVTTLDTEIERLAVVREQLLASLLSGSSSIASSYDFLLESVA